MFKIDMLLRFKETVTLDTKQKIKRSKIQNLARDMYVIKRNAFYRDGQKHNPFRVYLNI